MTLGEAIQFAEEHATPLLPFLRELELRRRAAEVLSRLVTLERRRRMFQKALSDGSMVAEPIPKIRRLRDKLKGINHDLRELADEPRGPVERMSQ